jgi:hypothetical protein
MRTGKKPYATVPNASRSQWLSVNPAVIIGATFAPGSISETNDSAARSNGVSNVERVPPCASVNSMSYSTSSPSTRRMSGSASAGVVPGGSLQSTVISQTAGMMLRFCDALIIVGENVGASSGSTISAMVGGSVSSFSPMVRRNASTSGGTTRGGA